MPASRAPRWLSLAAAALVLAACGREEGGACPGEPIGAFALDGARVLEPDPLPPSLPPCSAPIGSTEPIVVRGTLSEDPETGGAAFCGARGLAAPLFGTRTGDQVEVATETDGAVLGACGPSCAARVRIVLRGTLTSSPDAPPAFAGAWIERLSPVSGDCGGCTLPCDARYEVSGTVGP